MVSGVGGMDVEEIKKSDLRRLWYLLELNQGHMDFQSIALPPELRYLALFRSLSPHVCEHCEPFFAKKRAKVLLFFELPKFFLFFLKKNVILRPI